MLIGIDASRATSRAPTGTENYSRELIRALIASDRKNRFRLYTRESIARDFFGAPSNFEIRALPFPRVWTHARLSFEMLAHAPNALWVPAHVLPLIHPRRSFVTIHDLGQVHFPEAYPPLQRMYHNWAVWWSARRALHLFADSETTREDLAQFFHVPLEKISVVYPAYDARLYQPVRDTASLAQVKVKYRIGSDYILALGTIHPRKNYTRLIEAFAKLEIRDLRLVLAGKRGWRYDSIFALVQSLNLKSRISLLDYVPNSDLPALISGARLFVFPSLHEGFGLPVLEAHACGTPVVCSMTSSLPEAAGDAALFFDPMDVDAIAGALQRALNDDALRSRLVARGFDNLKRFSWEVSARQILNVIGRE
jgi:glycosyltransferase involved in cell wall biosynthesis